MKNLEDFEKLLSDFESGNLTKSEFITELRKHVASVSENIFSDTDKNNSLESLFSIDNKSNLLNHLDTLFFSFLETNSADNQKDRERVTIFYKELKTIFG